MPATEVLDAWNYAVLMSGEIADAFRFPLVDKGQDESTSQSPGAKANPP
jgi:hypothetical protein